MAEKVVENQDIIEIGNNIQKIRKKNGISQSVLAEKIDVAGNSIYRMEGATTVMGVDKLINIADAFLLQMVTGRKYTPYSSRRRENRRYYHKNDALDWMELQCEKLPA